MVLFWWGLQCWRLTEIHLVLQWVLLLVLLRLGRVVLLVALLQVLRRLVLLRRRRLPPLLLRRLLLLVLRRGLKALLLVAGDRSAPGLWVPVLGAHLALQRAMQPHA